ncbi:TPA_exp: Uncharacterized protein A8136_2536 [Trichophyton benhamiae CBS 112371]|uniref:Succinate dehydrogenase assembly factor 4, mitochondrial n=1 Tax=Arthroderma benhamiae (strain ATCC MYA-4681 / CBS 112371) TaxID=663331 RepID=D4AKN0_ARTBC|nr:uncharacterized protein ARB_04873 [Trichophyton benhamiae CBS 112371]EFE35939.1 hypothetical protein ARB_04873 [Trichophyton benhamiae CBS 112371]DAA78751.1 TPA_exp: Uncharacterized protein A8136_2536 [Trichophyton benhamiae CBS 112371]
MAGVARYRLPSVLRAIYTPSPAARSFTVSAARSSKHSRFAPTPSPPRLAPEEQEIFENLQQQSTGAFSTPRSTPRINQSPQSQPEEVLQSSADEELHPDLRRGAKPEFEGDKNPKTGEIGGPKNEPLRWGGSGDWSYNGRVTDF